MPLKINPITGQLDLVNSSSGGSPDASTVTYTPAVPGDWAPAPAYVDVALDQLAAASGSASGYVFINPIVASLTVPSPYIFLEHDMTITGTLTLQGTSELLVI